MSAPKIIDLYCRISKDYDGTLRAVEDQEEMGRAWLAEHPGYALGKVYRDHALSGWNPKVVRPEWEECMARLESGEADGVWVRDLDRFTRKLSEAERLLQAAEAGSVVIARHSSYDFSTARGKRQFREDAVDAAYESDRISERSARGKASKAKRGKSNASYRGFARDGYGPKPEGWEPGDPRELVEPSQLAREQEAVRQAVADLLAGGTLHGIAQSWNEAELWTVTGKRWDGGLVRQLLTAPSLAGFIVHKGEVVGELPGEHALDKETWRRLQTHLVSRKRGRPASAYLLSGFLVCGRCGGKLYGRPQTSRQPYPDGETRRQYWCQPREADASGCGRLTIDWRFADDSVGAMVLGVLGDSRHADRLAKVAVKVQEARQELQAELHRLEEDAKGIASKTAARGFAWVEAAMEPIDARMAELQEQLAELEEPDTTAIVDAEKAWKDATLAQRRAMVRRAFPKGITIAPASSRGKASLTADRFIPGSDPGSDRGGDRGAA
jgi:site-specific DNA recombinase